MTRWLARALAFCFLTVLGVFPTSGQALDTAAAAMLYPFDPVIEGNFEDGLAAWRAGDYDRALAGFKAVVSAPENRRTTAAMLMTGKSLLALSRYAEVVGLLSAFVERYPDSRYVDSARATLDIATVRYEMERERRDGVFELGVLLPMSEGAVGFTRSMFTGIRIAVDRFNERGGRQVRILFEDTGADSVKAAAAFDRLVERSSPGAIIGPLFSEEAVVVARLADSLQIPLLVPLATDEAVSHEKGYVFQSNPTYEMRGRIMARHAVTRLRHLKLGVIADSASFAARMAIGFEEEARELEAEVALVALLAELNEWYALSETFGPKVPDLDQDGVPDPSARPVPGRMNELDALYIPVTGGDASGLAAIALDEVDLVDPQLPMLGNGEWAHMPDTDRMARHDLIVASDFSVDNTRSDVIEFDREFRRRMSRAPDQPAYVGFDVASFLIDRLRTLREGDELHETFRETGEYQGLGIRINFGEGQVNRSMNFSRFTTRGLVED